MISARPNDEAVPVSAGDSQQASKLLPETAAAVRDLAKQPGNVSGMVEEVARRNREAAERGPRIVAKNQLEAAQRRRRDAESHLREAQSRLQHAEPKIIVKGQRQQMGLAGRLSVLILSLGLAFVLWNENGAAAQTLLSTGAFNVDTLLQARVVMATPVAVGLAFVLGFKALPWFVRRRVFPASCAILLGGFLIWIVAFSIQAHRYHEDDSQTIRLSDEAWASTSDDAAKPIQAGDGASAWVMLCSLTLIMSLTTFVGHVGLEHLFNRYETWASNPEHTRAGEDVHIYEAERNMIDQGIATTAGNLAAFEASVDREVALARALYTSLHNALGRLAMVALATIMFIGCDNGLTRGGQSRMPNQLDRWANQAEGHATEVTRVLAISPVLTPVEKAGARERLEAEIAWIANDAPVGSATVVVDGLNCTPIAHLKAVRGVSRIRRKALAKTVPAIRQFLNQPHAREKCDGRINLPRLAQTAKQWSLPPGSHVVVLGNPLFLNDSTDKFFSMADGRVPSDACLSEEPALNLYSVLGREKALTGQYWHLGWPDDAVFVDDTHRQAVLRFWFLYLQAQSAVLVTAQPSFAAATGAAYKGGTDPLMHADPDSSTRAAMVKIIKVQHEDNVELEPHDNDEVQIEAGAGHATRHVDAVTKPTQREVESEDVQIPEEKKLVDNDPRVRDGERDEHDNVAGSAHDLIADGQMMGQRIVLATFYSDDEVERSPLVKALTAKGFAVERVKYPLPDLTAFKSMLDESEQLWLWSSAKPGQLPSAHLQAIVERWQAGNLAICLLADNTPFTCEAFEVLSKVSPGSSIDGEYRGNHTLVARFGDKSGFDPTSPLFHNITTLYEGTTVSTMAGPGLVPVCFASDGSPLIATLQQEGSSRLVVHGGFTSFFERFWDDAGISRFAVNCAGWLNGADVKLDRASE